MRPSALLLVVCVAALSCAGPAKRTARPPEPETPEQWPGQASASAVTKATKPSAAQSASVDRVEPCVRGTPEHDDALAKLEALERQVNALTSRDDARPVNEAIAELLQHACWAIAEPRSITARSGLELRTWWDRGGDWWLSNHLELADDAADRTWIEPLDVPRALTLDSDPEHPLAPILCPVDDPTCGIATRGWLRRASTHFELYAREKRSRFGNEETSCDEQVATLAADDRFGEWAACESAKLLRTEALPLGSFEAPSDGWLIVRGRRGHYRFCDEIRAYGLARGSMYVARSCSGLALQSGGSVDHRATDAGRKVELVASRVNLDNLREAALMVLLSSEAQKPGWWHAEGRPIPPDVRVRERLSYVGFGGFSMSSGHTRLDWSWVRNGKVVASGNLQWPDDLNHAAGDHATKLIQIVESASVSGCARERLPRLPEASVGGVSGLDADPTSLRRAAQDLVDGMDDLRKNTKLCR